MIGPLAAGAGAAALGHEVGAQVGDGVGEGWRRLSPLGIVPAALRSLRQMVLGLVAVFYGSSQATSNIWIGPLVGLAVLLAVLGIGSMRWWRTRYLIGASDVRLHKGLIGRQARSVPFERIQDVSLEQRLIPRLLGLVEVRFETGAGGKDELKLAFVSQREGEALRETVRARIDPGTAAIARSSAGDDTPTPLPAAESVPLFAMSPGRLLTFGLFEFSLIVFAVLAGAVQQFDFLLPDIWDRDYWQDHLLGPNAWLAGIGFAASVIGAVGGLLAVGLLGMATGVVRTIARDYGFRLERTAQGFRRRRGLFTRSDVVMPAHRVQALKLTTGILRRIWGWHGLAFISLAQVAGSANHTVAPFARLDELAPIAREAGFTLPDADTRWHLPSPHYRTDRAILAGLVPLFAVGAALWVGEPLLGIAVAALGVLLAGRHLLLRRFERHAIDPRQLFERTALLSPRVTIAARAKLHSVEIGQGPLARRRGYACLRFGLAGGHLSMKGVPLEEARKLRAAVLASITAVDFSQLPG